jgi:hypothetical protein
MGIEVDGSDEFRLIAIMLGRLEMTVDDCIVAYEDFCRRVFVNEQFKLSFNPSAGSTQGHFDPTKLEQAIKEVILAEVSETDAKFVVDVRDDQRYSPCKVFGSFAHLHHVHTKQLQSCLCHRTQPRRGVSQIVRHGKTTRVQ